MTKAGKLTGIFAALAVIGFFLPWILVSCAGTEQKLTGFQLAAGGATTPLINIKGTPLIYISLIAPILIYLIFLHNYLRKKISLWAIFIQSVLAGLGISPVIGILREIILQEIQTKPDSIILRPKPQYGLWIVLVSFGSIILSCAFDSQKQYKKMLLKASTSNSNDYDS